MSSVADNADSSGAIITLSDGTNDYTATVAYSDLAALTADGSNDIALTFTGTAGTFTASIGTDIDQASGIDFSATTTTGNVATVASTSSTVSSAINLTVTGGTLEDGTANLTAVTVSGVTYDAPSSTATIALSDGTNTYTADVTYAQLATLNGTNTLSLTFDDADGNHSFTATIGSNADQTGQTFGAGTAITTGTVATVASTADTTASLSTGILTKVGSAANQTSRLTTAVTSTTATTFSISEDANAGLTFQVGANEGDSMSININKMDSQTLGVNSAKIDTQTAASSAISAVDKAINEVSAQRAYMGAIQNRLQYKIDNLNTSSENLTSAESQIRDVDMAKEMTTFTNANILSQASVAMLAQANSLPQSVLKLIGG